MIKEKLDSITEEQARKANLAFSTLAGLIYFFLLFKMPSLGIKSILSLIVIAIAFDWSTVYFVHSGVLSGTLTKVMSKKRANHFIKIHLWPGMIAYLFLGGFIISLFSSKNILLYHVFLVGWTIMYLSGLYPYSKLKNY